MNTPASTMGVGRPMAGISKPASDLDGAREERFRGGEVTASG